jgi:uroporphyrinogen-III decarboxylase
MLLAIDHKEGDHVPLVLNPFGWDPPAHLKFNNAFDRVEKFLAYGLDDTIALSPPSRYHPDVITHVRREISPGSRYPILFKEYRTPKGLMSQMAQQTDDWPHGDDIPVISDFNIPRSTKFLVSEQADLEKLPYLFSQPDKRQLRDFREHVKMVKRFAQKHQVMIEGYCGGFGDYASWFMGITNLMIAMIDRPDFVHQLLDTILAWEMRNIEILLDYDAAEVIIHRGWYEGADFWPPDLYGEFIAPRLTKKIQLVHEAGLKFGYIMSMGIMPLLDTFQELDFELLIHVDPIQGGVDLACLKEKIGDKICVLGGMNSAVTLTQGSKDDIRDAVTHAISILAPGGGLILEPADCLTPDISWDNVFILIERWREIGTYPIRV